MALCANCFGRHTKLIAEGACKCLVRAVPCIQGYGQDIGCTVGQRLGRFGQAAAADVAHDRTARGRIECSRQVKTRYSSGPGDFVERNFAGKVTLDKPERLFDCVHTNIRTSTGPSMRVILPVDLIEIALSINFDERHLTAVSWRAPEP